MKIKFEHIIVLIILAAAGYYVYNKFYVKNGKSKKSYASLSPLEQKAFDQAKKNYDMLMYDHLNSSSPMDWTMSIREKAKIKGITFEQSVKENVQYMIYINPEFEGINIIHLL